MDRSQLQTLLHNKSLLDIDLKEPFEAPSRTRIGKKCLGDERKISKHIHPCSEHISNYYTKVLGWLPANPNRPYLKQAIQSVYVFDDHPGVGAYNYVNTKEGHSLFLREIKNINNKRTVFLIGKKGAGKTFYLNYFFNMYSKELYKKRITWYRAEVTKLYKHNVAIKTNIDHEPGIKTREYTLEEYLNVHIVYVTFKYRRFNPIFQELWKNVDSAISDRIIDKWYTEERFKNIDADLLIEYFKDFIEKAELEEKNAGGDFELMKHSIKKLLWNSDDVLKSSLMASSIMAFLRDKGFSPVLIIDGLDNIDYYQNEKLYLKLLEEVRTYCLNEEKIGVNKQKFIISLRNQITFLIGTFKTSLE